MPLPVIACGQRQTSPQAGPGVSGGTIQFNIPGSPNPTDPYPGSFGTLIVSDVGGITSLDAVTSDAGTTWNQRVNYYDPVTTLFIGLWDAVCAGGAGGGTVTVTYTGIASGSDYWQLQEAVNILSYVTSAVTHGTGTSPLPPSLSPGVPNAMFVTGAVSSNSMTSDPTDPGWFNQGGPSGSSGFAWYVANGGDSTAHASAYTAPPGAWAALAAVYAPITVGQALPVVRQSIFSTIATSVNPFRPSLHVRPGSGKSPRPLLRR